jgi:hypothetical protein
VPNGSIHSIIVNFYNEEELTKGRSVLNEVCSAQLESDLVPRLITHKGDKKKKALADDIMALVVLLDEHKCEMPTFVAQNLRKVPQIDPGSVDMCFLLETVTELKKKVDMLDDLKKQMNDLQASVQSSISSLGASVSSAPKSVSLGKPVGTNMAQDTNLRVNLPPVSRSWSDVVTRPAGFAAGRQPTSNGNQVSSQPRQRPKPIVGANNFARASGLKASAVPRQIHLYVGNLDINTTTEEIEEFVREVDPAIRLHHNEIVRSTRFSEPRCISAHISVSGIDREKVLCAELWPEEITIRPWRFYKPRSEINEW